MAQRVRIDCIVKNDRASKYERIEWVGGPNSDGTRWKLRLADAIAGIQDGRWAFYTQVAGHTVDVVVARSAAGNLYLRTTADHDTPDNLLSLATCG